jgi:two-component sensor histidine kinase
MSAPRLSAEWRTEHLRLAIEAACVALWSWNVDDNRFRMDARGCDLWGVPLTESVEFEDLSAHIHPADRDRVRAAFVATRSVAGSYEIDFRVIIGDQLRWISARGQGADAGMVERVMYGIFIDVTGRKQAEEGSELLAGEMSHRVKNLLTVASSLTQLSSRSSTSIEQMTTELIGRLTALGRAHDLVRPLPGSQGDAALLGDLLSVVLAPYDDHGAFSGRIRVAVPRMGLGERSATALAMVIHELATNSVKHGALSSEAGALEISGVDKDGLVVLTWAETGGPAVHHAPELHGFGSRMLRSLSGQLGGDLAYDWRESGLVASLPLRKTMLAQ